MRGRISFKMETILLKGELKLYKHKTFELVNIIKSKCELIITMNITYSCLKTIADKNITRCYFVSCSRDVKNLCKECYFIATSHLKLYMTADKVFISTSNLSLSSWDELTLELQRTKELETFVKELEKNLKLKNDFMKAFY